MDRRSLVPFVAGIALVTACTDDLAKPPGPPAPPTSPEELVAALAQTYRLRCFECAGDLLASLPEAEFTFVPPVPMPDNTIAWGLATERLVTRRLLRPDVAVPGELPVPAALWTTHVRVVFSQATPFVERPDLYASPSNPNGLPPARWKAMDATYTSDVFVETQGEIDYQILSRDNFVVLEDLSKAAGEAGKFSLYVWEELEPAVAIAEVEAAGWSEIKALYATASPITSEPLFIESLAEAYRRRDATAYANLLGEDFSFILEPDPGNPEPSWGRAEEARIHQRMFEPENVPPGEPPVPPQLWLRSVTIALTPQAAFVERPDVYASPSNPEGLDRERWRATAATYAYNIFFETQGETDYQATGSVAFTVTADRRKLTGTPGRYALYRCEDLGTSLASQPATWTLIKKLYN